MSFLDSLSVYFPTLSELNEIEPPNHIIAKSLLAEFRTVSTEISLIYENHKEKMSDLDLLYKKELQEKMKSVETRLKTEIKLTKKL